MKQGREILGWIEINSARYDVTHASCDLFVGELYVDVECRNDSARTVDISFTLRCGEAIEYKELYGFCAEVAGQSESESTLINVDNVSFATKSLTFLLERFKPQRDGLTIRISCSGEEWDILGDEEAASVELSGDFWMTCDPLPADLISLWNRSIPAKFANFYLSRIGLPELGDNPSRADAVAAYGPVVRESENPGTLDPRYGFLIPYWTVHAFGSASLRCGYSEDYSKLTDIMFDALRPEADASRS